MQNNEEECLLPDTMVALTLINSVYVLFGFKIVQLLLLIDILDKLVLKSQSKRMQCICV